MINKSPSPVRRPLLPLRWTPKTGPVVKIENRGSERRGFQDGKDTESPHGGIQGEGGAGGGEGTGDGEPVGIDAWGSPVADPSVEEAVAGGCRGIVQQWSRSEAAWE